MPVLLRAIALACVVLGLAGGQDGGVATSRATPAGLPGTGAGGWREPRGDPANTGVSHGPRPRLSGVKWRFIAESAVLNSPAVQDGALYFGSKGGFLYAIRTSDGSKLWERSFAGGGGADETPGFTYGACLLHDGRLYIGSEDGHLYCVSQATGDLVWKRHLGGEGDRARIWASPKTDGRRVYLGSNAGHLWAFDPATGEPAWKTWIGDEIGGSVAIVGGQLVVPARDRRLHAVDAATGAHLWRADLGGSSKSSPAVQLGLAFVRASGGRVVCVDLVDGSVRWTAELPRVVDAPTSLAHDGTLAYVTNGPFAAAIGPRNEIKWQVRARASFDSSPVIVGEAVLLSGNDAVLRLLDKSTGATVAEIDLGQRLVATPTVVDGIVYQPSAPGIVFAVE